MFGIDGYRETSRTTIDGVLLVSVEIEGEAPPCPCGGVLGKNGGRSVRIRDVNTGMTPVCLDVRIQRYRCRDCARTAEQELPGVETGHNMTNRLVEFIRSECGRRTFAQIAEYLWLDESTVRGIHEEFADIDIAALNIETPRVMGIDEIHFSGTDYGVLTNIEEGTIYDLLENRSGTFLSDYFQQMPGRDAVRAIVMDDWKPYRDVARRYFSNAAVVVDKTHLIFDAGQSMEKARKQVWKSLPPAKRHLLTHSHRVLGARSCEPHLSEALEGILRNFPILAECRGVLEEFWKFWDESNEGNARENLARWRDSVQGNAMNFFGDLVRTTIDWENEILAYFSLPASLGLEKGLTNSLTEALNGNIRRMNQAARGMSFRQLRRKALLANGVRKKARRLVRDVLRAQRQPTMMIGMKVDYHTGHFETLDFGSDPERLIAEILESGECPEFPDFLVEMNRSSRTNLGQLTLGI